MANHLNILHIFQSWRIFTDIYSYQTTFYSTSIPCYKLFRSRRGPGLNQNVIVLNSSGFGIPSVALHIMFSSFSHNFL